MRHLRDAKLPAKSHSNGLEGEAHPRLEAIEEVGFGLEQRPAG